THEPYIWLSHSMEASIERTIEWIRQIMIDGYASLSEELFVKLLPAIIKRLEKDSGMPFAITLFQYPDEKLLAKVSRIKNLRILYQPTGYIRALEHDFKRAIIYGKNYTLFTTEPELLVLLNDTYYFGYWRNAEIIKEFEIVKGYTYTAKHQWIVIPIIENALKDNYTVVLNIVGKWVKTGRPAELEVVAKGVYRSPDDRTRTIIGETKSGEEITIGGLSASVEDIEAYYIIVKITG
ncbi:MAG: hypothetical protein J7K21_00750, partial [Desulfurococcales archaeon]|nr:hypothetical protein [Desulfurococcales archaeon]